MKKTTCRKRRRHNKTVALDLRGYVQKYAGLEITASDSTDSLSEGFDGTIALIEWVRPDWSEKPLLKFDFPHMGCVIYREAAPP